MYRLLREAIESADSLVKLVGKDRATNIAISAIGKAMLSGDQPALEDAFALGCIANHGKAFVKFKFSENLTNMLNETDISKADFDEVRLPFKKVIINDKYYFIETDLGMTDPFIVMINSETGAAGAFGSKNVNYIKGVIEDNREAVNMLLYLNSDMPDTEVKFRHKKRTDYSNPNHISEVIVGKKYGRIKGEYDDSGRKLLHRVLVRGHWRMQPYKDGVVKRIFIEPHFKGPKDSAEAIDKLYKVV